MTGAWRSASSVVRLFCQRPPSPDDAGILVVACASGPIARIFAIVNGTTTSFDNAHVIADHFDVATMQSRVIAAVNRNDLAWLL